MSLLQDYSTSQQAAIAIVSKVSASLSIAGSGMISYKVLSRKENRYEIKERLLLGLSFFDLIAVYFLVAVKSRSQHALMKRWEAYIHGTIATYFLVGAILAVVFDAIRAKGTVCMVFEQNGGLPGGAVLVLGATHMAVPVFSTIIMGIITMLLLYCHVRGVEIKMRNYAGRTEGMASRQVATQGLLYIFALLITYVPATIHNSILWSREDGSPVFAAQFIASFTFPLQGALNALVYWRCLRTESTERRKRPASRSKQAELLRSTGSSRSLKINVDKISLPAASSSRSLSFVSDDFDEFPGDPDTGMDAENGSSTKCTTDESSHGAGTCSLPEFPRGCDEPQDEPESSSEGNLHGDDAGIGMGIKVSPAAESLPRDEPFTSSETDKKQGERNVADLQSLGERSSRPTTAYDANEMRQSMRQ